MAGAISHYLHAQRVLDHLRETSKEPIQEDALVLGAQGPDFLFCYFPMPWRKGKERKLHRYALKLHQTSPGRTMTVLRDYCQSHRSRAIVRSYVYGFICHYSMDRIVHPFVKYGAAMMAELNPKENAGIFHHQIESALDTILLRRECGQIPPEFNLKKTVPNRPQVLEQVSQLYQFTLKELYDAEIPAESIKKSFGDFRFVSGVLNDRTGMKKRFLEQLERHSKHGHIASSHFRSVMEDGDYDYANICQSAWKWPVDSGEAQRDTYFELFEKAVADAVHLINDFFLSPDLVELTQDISF